MTIESAQMISTYGLGIFCIVCILCVAGLFFDVGRRAVRWLVLGGLSLALVMAIMGGRLYYWHHFERLFP